MNTQAHSGSDATLDREEVGRFAALAEEWWDPHGKFKPLHDLGPARLTFVRDQVCAHYGRRTRSTRSLDGLTVADVGCGGGLLCEPMARLGADVTGIDPANDSIEAARAHAAAQGLDITYRADRAETLIEEGKSFDAVLALEVVEHVPDVPAFIKVVSGLVRPGGILLLSTINRTLKSYGLAIIGAEYILRWLPVGTHRWDRFVTPDELSQACSSAGLEETDRRGIVFNPLSGEWSLSRDTDVNYLMGAAKPES